MWSFRGLLWEVDVTALPLSLRILSQSLRTRQSANGHRREDVASIQKSVIALLTLMAEECGHLSLEDPIGAYLGPGWPQLPLEQESEVLVRHMRGERMGVGLARARRLKRHWTKPRRWWPPSRCPSEGE